MCVHVEVTTHVVLRNIVVLSEVTCGEHGSSSGGLLISTAATKVMCSSIRTCRHLHELTSRCPCATRPPSLYSEM